MNLNDAQGTVVRTFNRGKLLAGKYSPEILMGLGIVGVVAGTVMACKATLKAKEVLAQTQEDIDVVHEAREKTSEEKYSNADYQKDLAIAYTKRGVSLVKLYGPSAIVGAAAISCLVGSHVVLSKRNMALVAAYKLVEDSFNNYRKRVVDELGDEKDKAFKYGITESTITETTVDEDGKKVKNKVKVSSLENAMPSQYARFFDETSTQWHKSSELNMAFLRAQQQYAQDALRSRGHLFLNEVYDMLGLPRSSAGAVVGWVWNHQGGDNYVDFGIYNPERAAARDFVNGYEKAILLDFNVDGVIYDLI